jgi:hypothetical protein
VRRVARFSIQVGLLPPDECEIVKLDYPCFTAGAGEAALRNANNL